MIKAIQEKINSLELKRKVFIRHAEIVTDNTQKEILLEEVENINNEIKELEEKIEDINNMIIPAHKKKIQQQQLLHFKRQGFADLLLIRNDIIFVEYRKPLLTLSISYPFDKWKIIYNDSKINTLQEAARTIEEKLNESEYNVRVVDTFIESYYIGYKNNDVDIIEIETVEGHKEKIVVNKDMTIKDLEKYNLKKALQSIYRHFDKIEDVFIKVKENSIVSELWQFIHDNNYKVDFREKFIEKYC